MIIYILQDDCSDNYVQYILCMQHKETFNFKYLRLGVTGDTYIFREFIKSLLPLPLLLHIFNDSYKYKKYV